MPNLASFHAAFVAASSSSKTSAASSAGTFIFILLLIVLAYFFFIRPRSAQARRQRETLQEVSVGDEILTGAGIFGRVLDVEADRITIETAPGTRITVLRSTIARRITEPADPESGWADQSDSGSETSEDSHHEALGGSQNGDTSGTWEEGERSGGDAAAGGEGGSR